MGCNSSYMNPTYKEQQLHETAKLLLYVYRETNNVISVTNRLTAAANNMYCQSDYVAELCGVLRNLPPDDFERIVYNARDPQSRKLADWWERHVEADKLRIQAEEITRSARAHLKKILDLIDPESLDLLKQHQGEW